MTPETIDVIQRSFALVARRRATAGQMFYERLLSVAPELRPMFKTDLTSQAIKLIDTLGLCVGQLRHPETVTASLANLGQRHVGYGVKAEHYAVVGETLLWTLERLLGPAFTAEVEQAWTDLYVTATAVMVGPLADVDQAEACQAAA